MKQFNRFLCFVMALVTLALCVASCGGEEPQETDPPVTTVGETTTAPTTTVPTTTAPTGNETTAPVTNPPEAVAPCATHTFAEGKLCTEERTCTVCHETVPAGEHTYSDKVPCTVDRPCQACSYVLPASAAHAYGEPYSCGSRYCAACLMIEYGEGCSMNCPVCGLIPLPTVPFVSIGGRSALEFTIITPADAPADYGDYLALALRNRLATWCDIEILSATDNTEKSGPEIRIGKTNRTVSSVESGAALIRVVGGDLELLCDGMYAYEALLDWVSTTFSQQKTDGVALTEGTLLSETYATSEAVLGDVRVMYHNILAFVGYRIPSSLRYSFYRSIYEHYMPDVIGMQETHTSAMLGYKAPGFFQKENYLNLRTYLENELSYKGLSTDTSIALFYNTETLELLAEDMISTRGAYGTAWALFRHKETGKVFGFTNSHFSANSTTNNDPVLGNEARINDAKSVNQAIAAIIQAAKAKNIEDADAIPVIAGGDYNCYVGSDPIAVLTSADLTNARDVITDPTQVDQVATYGNDLSYNETYGYHTFTGSMIPKPEHAIDHCYLYNKEGVAAKQYRVVINGVEAGASDHHPHYLDFSFQ